MVNTKSLTKKKTKKSTLKTSKAEVVKLPAGLELLKLETGVPIPDRTMRDPVFYNAILNLLKNIKPKQSFVLKKSKVHFTLNLAKKEFESYKMKSSIILPDKNFSRIWRIA